MSMPKIECTDISKCCAATSLLQSIALEETAISHILNAEGEKLQKAISMEKITNLEMVLKSKLDLIKPILEDCDKKPHSCACDCKCKDEK